MSRFDYPSKFDRLNLASLIRLSSEDGIFGDGESYYPLGCPVFMPWDILPDDEMDFLKDHPQKGREKVHRGGDRSLYHIGEVQQFEKAMADLRREFKKRLPSGRYPVEYRIVGEEDISESEEAQASFEAIS